MARPARDRPTDAELAVLRILWRRGPSTVREVYDELRHGRPTGYTSVLKVMQIMTDKKLVARDESARTHVYRAAAPEAQTLTHLAADLLDRAFGGSARAMILHALAARPSSPAELAQIRQLIDDFEADRHTHHPSEEGGNP